MLTSVALLEPGRHLSAEIDAQSSVAGATQRRIDLTCVSTPHRARPKTLAMRFPQRLIAPIVLIALIAAVWLLGLTDRLSWSGLARNQAILNEWVRASLARAVYVCGGIYRVGGAVLAAGRTVDDGRRVAFGTMAGGALAVIGATTGAVLLFLIARSAVGGSMAARGGVALGKLREDLQRDGFAYLLAIRYPRGAILAGQPGRGIVRHAARSVCRCHFIGIIPATFVIASIGAGIGGVLDRGQRPDLSVLVSWPVLGPLLALASYPDTGYLAEMADTACLILTCW